MINIDVNSQVTSAIIEGADESIRMTKSRVNRKLVPPWTEQCQQAVKDRNRAFRQFKRTHNMQHLIQFKIAQALVRRTARQAKKASWRIFCSTKKYTPVGDIWKVIKKMGGDKRMGISGVNI